MIFSFQLCRQFNSLFSLIILTSFLSLTTSQSTGNIAAPPPPAPSLLLNSTNPTSVVFTVLVCCFIFFAFFFYIFASCKATRFRSNTSTTASAATTTRANASSGTTESPERNPLGLNPNILNSFPILEYDEIKNLKTVKGDLQCAVCIMEFIEGDSLRLLSNCCHIFHPACIDKWLSSHITCPVCRADLSDLPVHYTPEAIVPDNSYFTGRDQSNGTTSAIHVDTTSRGMDLTELRTPRGMAALEIPRRSQSLNVIKSYDRYTLHLPEDVRMEIIAAGHRRAASLAIYRDEYCSIGAGSSRVASERVGRFCSFFRALSLQGRRQDSIDDGECSTKRMSKMSSGSSMIISSRGASSMNRMQRSSSLLNYNDAGGVVGDRVIVLHSVMPTPHDTQEEEMPLGAMDRV